MIVTINNNNNKRKNYLAIFFINLIIKQKDYLFDKIYKYKF